MKRNYESGQSLLVIVLLIAVVFTLIASASFRLTTETQSAKIQEDTVRTLAAADSGIEKGLERLNTSTAWPQTFTQMGINLAGVNPASSTINITTASQPTFATDIRANEQYTFYLYDYPNGTPNFNSNLTISFGSGSDVCGAGRTLAGLEITLMYGANLVNKWLAEPCTSVGAPLIQSAAGTTLTLNTSVVPGYVFDAPFNALSSAPYNNAPRILIIRSLYAEANVRIATTAAGGLPIQGHTITSTAVSNTGVSKVVSLFRSYPQLPADFYVTNF